MRYIFLNITLGLLFFHFHHVLSTDGKQVWEFGKELPQSNITMNDEGRVDKQITVLNLKVPHCNEVDYVKVEVDNPTATPEVTSNFKSVTIKYNGDQLYESTYKIVFKSHKTCDFRRFMECKGPGNVCTYGDQKPKKKRRKPKDSSAGDESEDDEVNKVWQFGKDVSGSFLMTDIRGSLGKGSKGVSLKLQETRCQRVAYVKVEVQNSATLPKVTSNKKIVSINYNYHKNKRESTYKIHAKGVKSC